MANDLITIEGMHLTGMSANKLERISQKAADLAADLRKTEPSYRLALAAGVCDVSYRTVRWGVVASYSGEVIITMEDGSTWRAVGHGSTGTAEYVDKQGYIEFIPLPTELTST